MKVYTGKDLKTNLVRGARVAVVGYGTQGHAHALNLRESGADVVVGARAGGNGWRRAEADGFRPVPAGEAVSGADYAAVLLPDESHRDAFVSEIAPRLAPGAALVFAHGFSVAFGFVEGPESNDVLLVAPKAQGHYLRKAFVDRTGVSSLVAIEKDASGFALDRALSYAQCIGCLDAGAIETSFRDEAVTDLFGEQAVLCGGVPALVKAAFETLVERGYPPEVAYIECLHELKIITDLMFEGGVSYMRGRISGTAAWGSFLAEKKMVPEAVRSAMRSLLGDIESGVFAEGWHREASAGCPRLKESAVEESKHPIERAGRDVRAIMQRRKEENR
jgi:ketol-acid reductoisomerase